MSKAIPDQHVPAVKFLGRWKAAAQDGFQTQIEKLKIEYHPANQTSPFTVELTKSDGTTESFPLDYEDTSDILKAKDEYTVGFWRNPSADIIFVTYRNPLSQQNAILTARRIETRSGNPLPFKSKRWKITNSNGNHAPAVSQIVCLRKLKIKDGSLDMYGLYWRDKKRKPWHLYDMVYYHAARDCFLSVFGVRILKVLPNGGIFASFDNSYSTPSGFTGGGFLGSGGELNLFGESQDPDAGCWCGEPD